MACGIIIYGIDYIRSHMDNIRQWKEMNPDIDFIITTVAEEEEKATIAEITAGFEVIFIEEPIVQWCKHEMRRLGVAIHFLSDVMRWFCLDAIKDRGEKVFLIEADVVCLRRNWMIEYPLTDALTLFGTDRACALFCPYPRAMGSLIDLVTFYRNVYEYLIEENIFVGNFDHLMGEVVLNDVYRGILAKPIDQRSTEEDERNYLNGITHGLMGIGQRHFFGIHVQDGVEDVMYMHLKKQEWRKKTKRNAKDARAERMAKMKRPSATIVQQIGRYDMSSLRVFTITSVPGTSTYILTHGRQCAKIKIRDILYVDSLHKCGHSGTFTLRRLIDFAEQNDLEMELEDVSTLEEYDIDLALLKIAQTGNTWYGKYGFQNGLEERKAEVHAFIQSPYKDSTYQVKAIEWADRLKAGDETVVDDLKELCQHVADFLKGFYTGHHRRTRRA